MNQWLRFKWDLGVLADTETPSHPPFIVRLAERDEASVVQKVVHSAFSMDASWGDTTKNLEEYLRVGVAASLSTDPVHCIVLQHGSRVIGASAFSIDPAETNNLLTGPCILHEYRSRGLGSWMLELSLLALRDHGMKQAYGVSRVYTPSAKFLYPKFGGVSEVWESPVRINPKLAA
jgi:hypothetical protein